MISDPIQNPLDWDTVIVAGTPSPGLCTVNEFKRKWGWDEKHGKGSQGASLTYTGKHLARGTIDFLLRAGPNFVGGNLSELDQWIAFAELFEYDPTKATQPNAVSIYHPSLSAMKPPVTTVICEDITNLVRVEPGLYRVVVSLIEYAPAPAVSAVANPTPKAKAPPGPLAPPGLQPDPADVALQKQIAAQLAIAQRPL